MIENSPVCKLLNIKYPIIQGGMAWVATGELAAAVSEAGGLGVIGAGNAPAEVVEAEIKIAKKLTNKPFGVNIMLLSDFVDDVVKVILREEVAVVTTGAGNPGKYIEDFRSKGIKIIPVVSSVALAKRLDRLGVDAFIAEGKEAGGHIGELTTMVLVPQIVDAVTKPVIAAGGIADGRGIIAAVALGATGFQLGTRFVCAHECTAHDNYKKALLKAKDRDTIVTGRSTGHPVRVIKNKFVREFQKLEKSGASAAEIEALGVGKLPLAVKEGNMELGSIMAGQSAGMVTKEESAAEIVQSLVNEAQELLAKMKA